MLEDRTMEEQGGVLVPRAVPAGAAQAGFALRVP
jgi:hypothetical protein